MVEQTCPRCHGKGEYDTWLAPRFVTPITRRCNVCGGSGRLSVYRSRLWRKEQRELLDRIAKGEYDNL